MTTPSFDDRDGYIWMDGKMLPWREAKIHYLTHALHYGTQVFEGERAYDGVIFKSRRHSERLVKSADIVHMDSAFTADQIEQVKKEVLEANGLKDAYIRAAIWRGSEKMGVDPEGALPHMAVAAWEWKSYFGPEVLQHGISLGTSRWHKPSPESAPVQSKTASLYNVGAMAKYEVKRAGFMDALMHDHEGYVAESTASNLFAIKEGVIHTPIADRFLNGLTRQTVIELAAHLDIPLTERRIRPEEMGDFEEVFLTGSASELTPVGKIDDKTYTIGPVTKRLQAAYQDLTHQRKIGD